MPELMPIDTPCAESAPGLLSKARTLVTALNAERIRYCHWKSTIGLAQGLSGGTDLDFLVHREDGNAFRSLLARLGFRPADGTGVSSFPSTEHYFGLDDDTGALVHVHVYFRVITGESLVKNYRLPLEDMLLGDTREEASLPIPTRGAELVIFTLRMLLKHTRAVELALLARDWSHLWEEVDLLIDRESVDEAVRLVGTWLPGLDAALFLECVDALKRRAALVQRIRLGFRLRSNLAMFARRSRLRASWDGVATSMARIGRRFLRTQRGMVLRSGGDVVAFVGAEATGKSTLLGATHAWLGEHFLVHRIHAGKPPSTPMTLLPNLIVPLLRIVAPDRRSSAVEARCDSGEPEVADKDAKKVYPISFAIRAVLLAYDRRAVLRRAFRRASNGAIVLCDRYPFMTKGTPDGPRLMHYGLSRARYPVRHFLADVERRLYLQIPRPDMVVSLTVPIDVALVRNRNRGKYEPEDYVRRRHAQTSAVELEHTPVYRISTSGTLEETLRTVKRAIWKTL